MDSSNKKVLKVLKKNEEKFYCEKCDYCTSNQSNFSKHLTTRKHILNASLNEKYSDYKCEFCDRCYKNRSGLWYHKKKCDKNIENENQCNIIIKVISFY